MTSLSLSPRRALLHPLWIVSAIVLGLNDHFLKGSGVLPPVITGKLSDFAGLVVAPVLLAWATGVTTRRGWLLAQASVAAVFAAIQLSAVAATAWSQVMASVGFPWWITSDPTDLIGLAALVPTHLVLGRVMQRPASHAARRSLEFGVASVGLLLCAATSQQTEFVRPRIDAEVFVHNASDRSITVRVRGLKPGVDLDCAAVGEDPGRLLTEPLFGVAESWLLEPQVNLALEETPGGHEERECHVRLVDADGMPPRIVFWQHASFFDRGVPGEGLPEDTNGGIVIEPGEDDHLFWDLGEGILFAPIVHPPQEGECAPQDDASRLTYSDPLAGQQVITGIDVGLDGCFGVDLVAPEASNDPLRWYLCAPLEELPFAVGDVILFVRDLEATLEAPGLVVRLVGDDDHGAVELHLRHGSVPAPIRGISFGLVPEFACELASQAECGTVARGAKLAASGVGWSSVVMAAGTTSTLTQQDGSEAEVVLAHAQERVVVDAECAEGSDVLGIDLEIAVVWRGPGVER